MNKEEFIGKLQMVYVGDRNAFNEIVEDNQKLKDEVIYAKTEIDRLNNIINELEKWLKKEHENGYEVYYLMAIQDILDKLKELKVNK